MDIINDLWHLILDLSRPIAAIGMVYLVFLIHSLIEENKKLRSEYFKNAERATQHLIHIVHLLAEKNKDKDANKE